MLLPSLSLVQPALHLLLTPPTLLPPSAPPCSPAGSFSPIAGSHECDVCEPGSFSNTTASSSCYKCLPGYITIANGDAGATECTACGRGTFRAANATDNKCQR